MNASDPGPAAAFYERAGIVRLRDGKTGSVTMQRDRKSVV